MPKITQLAQNAKHQSVSMYLTRFFAAPFDARLYDYKKPSAFST